jgi:hypothetical protein
MSADANICQRAAGRVMMNGNNTRPHHPKPAVIRSKHAVSPDSSDRQERCGPHMPASGLAYPMPMPVSIAYSQQLLECCLPASRRQAAGRICCSSKCGSSRCGQLHCLRKLHSAALLALPVSGAVHTSMHARDLGEPSMHCLTLPALEQRCTQHCLLVHDVRIVQLLPSC